MFREFEAAQQRLEREQQRDLVLAWHIVALGRQKRLPQLRSLIKTRRKSQSVDEMRATLGVLSEQYGFPLR